MPLLGERLEAEIESEVLQEGLFERFDPSNGVLERQGFLRLLQDPLSPRQRGRQSDAKPPCGPGRQPAELRKEAAPLGKELEEARASYETHRQRPPAFSTHSGLPALDLEGGRATVIVGELAGARSPSVAFSPLVGADLVVSAGARLVVPLEPEFEHALVLLEGEVELDGGRMAGDTLYYLGMGRRALHLTAPSGRARALVLGGAPFGETVLMWWNFVARTTEEIVAAREDWAAGRRFGEVKGYRGERLEAPPLRARPRPGR